MEEKLLPKQRIPSLARPERSSQEPVAVAVLESAAGTECFLTAESPPDLDLAASWKALSASYHHALRDAGLDLDTEVFVRLHVSDALNQMGQLRDSIGVRGAGGLVSIIGQSPLQRNKIALEAYHVRGRRPCRRRFYPGGQLVVDHGSYQMVWGAFHTRAAGSSAAQTTDLLHQLEGLVASHSGSVCDDVLRTWFFVRDIDTNYKGLVEARRELFAGWGMTAATHYVASTGIAGEMSRYDEVVALDALLEFGLHPAQSRFLTAESHLCPTHHYGVTFERGTRITYGDRTHYLISGTASIDKEGNVLHEGDLDGQVERTLENIEALLSSQGAHLSDLKQAVVYLRDPSDGARARLLLASLLPRTVPFIVVEGRVCRAGWLVEIEGIGGIASGDERFPDYF
jgi:enamine deaminase RidA (YjgF/YER057c/UK114 family)